MLIQFGSIVSDARGKLGGSVFSKNAFGANAFSFQKQVVRRFNASQVRRSRFGYFAQRWKALTQAQRDSWIAAALTVTFTNRFGVAYNPTGFSLFQSCSINRYNAGGANFTTAPAMTYPDPLPSLSLLWVSNVPLLFVDFAAAYDGTNNPVSVFASQRFSDGRAFTNRTLLFLKLSTGVLAGATDYSTEYDNAFGQMAGNNSTTVKVVPVRLSSGLAGTPTYITQIG